MFWLQRAGIVKIGAPPFPPVSASEKMNKRKEKSRGQEDGQGDMQKVLGHGLVRKVHCKRNGRSARTLPLIRVGPGELPDIAVEQP